MTIFDKILKQEIPSYKIYEDQDTYAFLDISAVTPGHTLVISKQPGETFLDIDEAHYLQVMKVAQKIAKEIVEKFGAKGCNLLTNAQPVAGQTVMKFHVHIIPRYDENDHLTIHFHENPDKDLESVFKKLK